MVESTVVAEWIAQGEAAALLRVLKLRFSEPVVAEVAATIAALTDRETLARWLDAAVLVPSWEAFRTTAGI